MIFVISTEIVLMKATFILLFTIASLAVYSQQKADKSKTPAKKTTNPATHNTGNNKPTEADMAPRQTVTDRYLNGPANNTRGVNNNGAKSTDNNSPFVGGIHAANNATNTFDSVQLANPNTVNDRNATNAVIPGGNDTTFNVNTINASGVTTNSGAVDRSGQSQFGQTNWGNSRSTVGESQWTVPPPITVSFNKEFPAASNATWTRNNVDTSIYSARYKSGAAWVITNYSNAGQRLDTKTEIALLQAPRPVSVYLAKQPPNFQPVSLYFLQMQGKPDMYEITTRGGKTIYINNEGMEVNH
jgi:hypothetical protein